MKITRETFHSRSTLGRQLFCSTCLMFNSFSGPPKRITYLSITVRKKWQGERIKKSSTINRLKWKPTYDAIHYIVHLQWNEDIEGKNTHTYAVTHASNSPYLSVTWLKCVQSAKCVTSCSFPCTLYTRTKNTFSVHYCWYIQICANMLSLSFHDLYCQQFSLPLLLFISSIVAPFTIHRLFICVYT